MKMMKKEDMETEPPQSPRPNHYQSDSEPKPKPNHSSFSSVDTSRPFSSVKEAVAIFGERLISGELYSYPKPLFSSTPRRRRTSSLISFSEIQPAHEEDTPRNRLSGFSSSAIEDAVRRIEADLEHTKMELKILKMRESETEVILASLNAELHRSMSIIAKAEAVEAAMARETVGRDGMREKTFTLGQIMSSREEERFSLERGRGKAEKMNSKKKKKKPFVPLLLDLFSRKKKGSSSLYSSASVHLN